MYLYLSCPMGLAWRVSPRVKPAWWPMRPGGYQYLAVLEACTLRCSFEACLCRCRPEKGGALVLPRICWATYLTLGSLLAVSTGASAQEHGAGPRIEIRNARLSPAPRFLQVAFAYPEYLPASLKEAPGLSGVHVAVEPMLSDEDFGDVASMSIDRRGLHLIVKLTPEGAARMEREATLGEYIAILVDGALVDAAPLGGYFSAEVPLFMLVRVPEPIAENLAAHLKQRWPQARGPGGTQ